MVSKKDEPKIDFKALKALTEKVLAYKPKKKDKPAARSSPTMRF